MNSEDTDSREKLIQQVNRYTWVHSIDLGDGLVTEGKWGPPNPLIMKAFDEIDFKHKKVLDIGCWDGLWSFEAEKRGAAEVYATDYISQRSYKEQPTFLLAHKMLKSKARYYPNTSVYNITELPIRDFDVVIFCGIYYHLKNPLLAFTRLREVMKEGGVILVEGEVIANSNEAFARFYYHKWYRNDPSNWWVPTTFCLRQWIECSFFDIVGESKLSNPSEKKMFRESIMEIIKKIIRGFKSETVPAEKYSRCLIAARATCRKDPNYVFRDDDLTHYDLNEYVTQNKLHGP